jgi:hypothetical protein
MASIQRSIKHSPDLDEAVQIRWKALGYRSHNAYHKGLERYDLMVQGDHAVTLPISQSRDEEQDKVDAQLLELTKQGKGIRGQFLVGLLKEMSASDFDSPDEAAEVLAQMLARINEKISK